MKTFKIEKSFTTYGVVHIEARTREEAVITASEIDHAEFEDLCKTGEAYTESVEHTTHD